MSICLKKLASAMKFYALFEIRNLHKMDLLVSVIFFKNI